MNTLLAAARLVAHPSTDRALLAVYAARKEEAAFAELVRRHAAMVRRAAADICPSEADDVTQAAFVLLGERSATLATRESAAGWLFETARRLALKARTASARRNRYETAAPTIRTPTNPLDEMTFAEVRAIIAEELSRLPDRLRVPLVLCYWEGVTLAAAGDRLGCSASAIKRRLSAARNQLAARLARRGFTGAGVLTALAALEAHARATVHTGLVAALTIREPGVRALSQEAAALVRSAIPFPAFKCACVAVLVAAGFGLALGFGPIAQTEPAEPSSNPVPAPRDEPLKLRTDVHGDPLPAGAVARMGSVRWRHLGNSRHIVPSPTGKHVAVAGEGTIRVFDLTDGRPVSEVPWPAEAGCEIRFTSDGTRVYYLAERGVVRFFNSLTGIPAGETKPVHETDVPQRERRGPSNTEVWNTEWTMHRLTNDGRWIVTAHPIDRKFTFTLTEITVTPAAKPRQVRFDPPPGYGKGVDVYYFACTGDTLVGAGREWTPRRRGPVVFCWDIGSGKITKTTSIRTSESGFDLAPDGKRLVTIQIGANSATKVWNTESGAESIELEDSTRGGYDTRFSPDGKRVVGITGSADGRAATATVWQLESGKVVSRVKLPGRYTDPFLLPDGKTLLAASRGLMLSTWDITTGHRLSPATGHENGLHHLLFSTDGGTLFTASIDRAERVTMWDAVTGKRLRELPGTTGDGKFVSPDGGATVIATEDGALVWVIAASGREVQRVETTPLAPGVKVPLRALLPASDPATGKPAVFSLADPPEGPKLVTLWDAGSGRLLSSRPITESPVDRFEAISPDGRFVARSTARLAGGGTGSGIGLGELLGKQAVVIEDTVTGRGLLSIAQPDYLGRAVLFTRDGRSLITWTSTYPDNGARPGATTVRLWELRSGKQRLAFSLAEIGKWWEFEPKAVSLSADGRLLAAARTDNTISVWDLVAGKEVAKRSGYGTPVGCLAFRPDGKALASGHDDGTALVWDLSGVTLAKPTTMDQDAAWNDLASDDAGKAYRAILALAADPKSSEFIRDRVKPTVAAPADEVRKLIADLGNNEFATREKATAGLSTFGDAAEGQLLASLKENLSPEQRKRVEELLNGRKFVESDPERLRAQRCIEVLEHLGTPEAVAVLRGLAKGAVGARLTQDATDTQKRLEPTRHLP